MPAFLIQKQPWTLFPTLNYSISLLSLSSCLLNWLYAYLTSHSQQVIVTKATSSLLPVISNAPQNTILGLLLFIPCISGIGYVISHCPLLLNGLFMLMVLLLQPINSSNLSSFQVAIKSDVSCFVHVMQRSHSRYDFGWSWMWIIMITTCVNVIIVCVMWESSRNPQAPEPNDNAISVKLE